MELEKLSKESPEDYALFCQYVQMRPRDLFQLSLELSLDIMYLKAISKTYKWNDRALEYDKKKANYFASKQKEVISALASDLAHEEFEIRKINTALIKTSLVKMLQQELLTETTKMKPQDIEKLTLLMKNILQSQSQDDLNIDVDLSDLTDKELQDLKDKL